MSVKSENSPMKRNRVPNSPRHHPYDRTGRSPLHASKSNNGLQCYREVKTLPLTLVKKETDFFSFSGGSSSLFPSPQKDQGQSTLKIRKKTDPVGFGIAKSEQLNLTTRITRSQKEELATSSKSQFGVIGGNRRSSSSLGFIPLDQQCTIKSGGSYSLFPSPKKEFGQAVLQGYQKADPLGFRPAMSEVSNVIARSQKGNQTKSSKPHFGVIGGGRRSTSMGFIPVDQSCTIIGNGNNFTASRSPSNPSLLIGNGKGRASSFTCYPQGMIENEPEDLTQGTNIQSLLKEPLYKHKVIHAKTFHPPTLKSLLQRVAPTSNSSFSIYESPEQPNSSIYMDESRSFELHDQSMAESSNDSIHQSRLGNSSRIPLSDISSMSDTEGMSFLEEDVKNNDVHLCIEPIVNRDEPSPCGTDVLRFENESKPKNIITDATRWRGHTSQHDSCQLSAEKTDKSSNLSVNCQLDELNTSFSSNDETENRNKSRRSFSKVPSVTTGVIGQLQPRGLNTSFTEKFVSHLGLNTTEGQNPQTSQLVAAGILTQRYIPLFDFPEYTEDILQSMYRRERKFRPQASYMYKHKEISFRMRCILVDWIAEVVAEYELLEETFHLTVNYIDRFLGLIEYISREKLQLVATAAMFIACKFEEVHPLPLEDFVYVTDDAYTKQQVLSMEILMLNMLHFDLMIPTAHNFAMLYCAILRVNDQTKSLASYLVDLSLLDGEIFLNFLPSVIATAALCIGRFTFEGIYWDIRIQRICSHRKKTITPCAKLLHTAFFYAPDRQQKAILEKYKGVNFCSISQAFIPGCGPWDTKC